MTQKDKALLASCYRSCLELADQNGIKSIAFCCISTGEYHFPNNEAAEIALKTVRHYRRQFHSAIKVIFNVYKDIDYQIYKNIYGFQDMYSGGFYPFSSPEEHWAYWSRYIYINRYKNPPKLVYDTLLKRFKAKDYFVVTTNVDHCFQKAGFDKSRLFYTQDDYGLFQCRGPCCHKTWDNEIVILKMLKQQDNMRIPSDLLPVCPHCDKPMK